jgi:hypothetical protein
VSPIGLSQIVEGKWFTKHQKPRNSLLLKSAFVIKRAVVIAQSKFNFY